MADFGELCPLFNTGVYKELFLGRFTTSVYYTSTTLTLNFLSNASTPATNPSSFRFGRTVVVTGWYVRKASANVTSATVYVTIGRRTGTGTAAASIFGTAEFLSNYATFPDLLRNWAGAGMTASMTLHTADVLNFSNSLGADDCPNMDIIIQYREK